jgi:hypothetical protein
MNSTQASLKPWQRQAAKRSTSAFNAAPAPPVAHQAEEQPSEHANSFEEPFWALENPC